LWEEHAATPSTRFQRFDNNSSKTAIKGPSPLPLPRPPDQAKPVGIADEKAKGPQRTQSVEDKMAALIAYRMARSMCKKCGEKWGRGHQCSTTVQLNVL
jgi:hypothetical protein